MESVLGSWSVEMSTQVFGTKLGVVWEMAVKVCLHASFFSLVTYFHCLW